MTARDGIIEAVRSRLAGAFPDARDLTDDPIDAREPDGGAFGVSITDLESERVGMSAGGVLHAASLVVSVWAVAGASEGLSSKLRGDGSAAHLVQLAIMSAPLDLGGLVFDILPAGVETDVARGNRRLGRADCSFDIQYITGEIS